MEVEPIGYFSKTHGLKGHLLLKQYRGFDPGKLNVVFLELAGSRAPFFVDALSETGNGTLFLLETIDSVEKAKPLVNKQVFADKSCLVEERSESEFVGYSVHDKSHGMLGTVTEVSDNGAQELLHIETEKGEIVLPFVDDLIESIDDEKKTIYFNAPEGLIDMYLHD